MAEIPDNAPSPKQCHIVKWPDFDGYGFNLHADKNRPGQYIGKVDENSPAEMAGLKEYDRIIEVNGVNIFNENHKQVVQRIKSIENETRLLVVDREADKWYKDHNIVISSSLPNVVTGSSLRAPEGDAEEGDEKSREEEAESTEGQRAATNGHRTPTEGDRTPPMPSTNGHHGRGDADSGSVASSAGSSLQESEGSSSTQPQQLPPSKTEDQYQDQDLATFTEVSQKHGNKDDNISQRREDEEGVVSQGPGNTDDNVSQGHEDGDDVSQRPMDENDLTSQGLRSKIDDASQEPAQDAVAFQEPRDKDAEEMISKELESAPLDEVEKSLSTSSSPEPTGEAPNYDNFVFEKNEVKDAVDGYEEDVNGNKDEVMEDVLAAKGDEDCVKAKDDAKTNEDSELKERDAVVNGEDKMAEETDSAAFDRKSSGRASSSSSAAAAPPPIANGDDPTVEGVNGANESDPEESPMSVTPTTTPTPPPTEQAPVPTAPKTTVAHTNTSGLNLNMTAAEMRAQLASRKKFDPRKDTIDLKKKYQIIQNM